MNDVTLSKNYVTSKQQKPASLVFSKTYAIWTGLYQKNYYKKWMPTGGLQTIYQ